MDFPGISNSKESAYNAGDPGSIPGLARSPGEVLLPVDLHGYRSMVGYSPWGCKEWDTTELLTHRVVSNGEVSDWKKNP